MTTPVPSEADYLREIQGTYADLDRWRLRAHRLETPQPRSELDADDKVFPKHPVSETARLSLTSSGEHLRAVATTIEAVQLYPTATFTTLRGALVGAAQAVWILSPDDPHDRQQRALAVVRESYVQLRAYDNEVLKDPGLTETERLEVLDHVEWLTTRIGEVDALRTSGARLDLTNIVIPGALNAAFDNERLTAAGILQWRMMGGDAHVLPWAIVRRGTFSGPEDEHGRSEGAVAGNFGHIAEPFILAYRLVRVGWGLFDRRCEGP